MARSDSPQYKIVAASPLHLLAVPLIEQAAAALFSEADLPLALRYLVTDEQSLIDAQDNGEIWMALDSAGRPVGFAMATELDEIAHLDEMDVMPEHGRQGIGRRLALQVIAWAREQGYGQISLVTFRHLPWNGPFYRKLGFLPVERASCGPDILQQLEEERDAGINMKNRIVMRKDLR